MVELRTSDVCSTFLLSFHFIPVEELDEAEHGHKVVRGVLGDGARDVLQQCPHNVLAAPSESQLLCTVILRLKCGIFICRRKPMAPGVCLRSEHLFQLLELFRDRRDEGGEGDVLEEHREDILALESINSDCTANDQLSEA